MYLKKSIDAINKRESTLCVTFFSERSRNKYFKLYTLDGGRDLTRPSSEFLVYWDNTLK
jgi:hypothetical protein